MFRSRPNIFDRVELRCALGPAKVETDLVCNEITGEFTIETITWPRPRVAHVLRLIDSVVYQRRTAEAANPAAATKLDDQQDADLADFTAFIASLIKAGDSTPTVTASDTPAAGICISPRLNQIPFAVA
ncbi:MAG: hypothetical protein Q8O25_08325 [Sulfurisoma sp.]|nr:hypothetical protein [Sulfurisoma sp.]